MQSSLGNAKDCGHNNGVIWMAVPYCLMWCIWRERNNRCFEDFERTIADLKLFFFKTLSDWMSIIGSHSIFSVYDLKDACHLCFLIIFVPCCILPIYLGDSLLCFWIKFSLPIKKKKHPAHSWNKAHPKKDPRILTPNPAVDDKTKCPNAASHQRTA